MPKPKITLLDEAEIQAIHETSLKILKDVGVRVSNPQALDCLAEAGAAGRPVGLAALGLRRSDTNNGHRLGFACLKQGHRFLQGTG